ncbi:sigma 54 modulation/S30EA ribosomal C-terminal domain-containing protein [Streptacidiphilus jiangxiensis]|uniref:Sigma 54 modulation/S30EA ribosomal protein C terminus n=3 Tax=Streptacidiphilus jiangxiensis TaxID=235985 RepID=A0A1H7V826_STRJI|nr:sigma 54 modulation/S30EA ribosomal C-terminal domain-containing protein [Streptacidiphilus jiangxiensis]SEM05391.1 Sigma 54 modulation/S30EA ribosomal protein C terminus [Streptacidiphilus jiangxiensis]
MNEAIFVRADGVALDLAHEVRRRVGDLVSGTDALVEALRVRLSRTHDEDAEQTVCQVDAEVDGRRVRVQRLAADARQAGDRLVEGLRQRIAEVSLEWRPRPWTERADAPEELPAATRASTPWSERAASAGRAMLPAIARIKEPLLVWCAPEVAVRTLDAMDYQAHLFTDPATEQDSVVYRAGPTGYRLASTWPAETPRYDTSLLTLCPRPAPRLSDDEAVQRCADAELSALFYADPSTGRGRLLYRRFDGRFGLVRGE